MIRTLQDHGIHLGLDVFMEHTVVTLLKDGDRIAGAFGYDRERGRFHLFRAKAVVLATGGSAGLIKSRATVGSIPATATPLPITLGRR